MLRFVLSSLALVAVVPRLLADEPSLIANPARVVLRGLHDRYQLLIDGRDPSRGRIDRTRQATYSVVGEPIIRVSPQGEITPLKDGQTQLKITEGSTSITIPVEVTGTQQPRVFHFETDIAPLLSRYACNAAGCHGKAEGQNGFKLSVFGFDPQADHAAITREARGRRVFPASPDSSLLLTKATGAVPHGGGTRLTIGTEPYKTLRDWIAAGSPIGPTETAKVVGLKLEPGDRSLIPGQTQQLRVIARFSDQQERDVTRFCRFQSNRDMVASVSPEGLVTAGDVPGEAAVMAAYLNEVAVLQFVVPRPGKQVTIQRPHDHPIDALVDAKLARLNIEPSDLTDDAEFLRRVYLDLIGTLPSAAEARQFLSDKAPDRRVKLIDTLLARPEYADRWTLIWADVLRIDRGVLGPKRAYAFHRWLHQQIRQNTPFDQVARSIVAARGPLDEVPPANFYQVVKKPGEIANTLSQVFLGVRIACAECHHHPFDRWGQDDYAAMSAYFSPVGIRKLGGHEAVVVNGVAEARHPRTGATVKAAPLGRATLPELPRDPRTDLATWMTAPDNPYFARNVANRIWAALMGKGIVDPVDDVRATNPPSNPALLDALAQKLVESKFDTRQLVWFIVTSRTYQASATPTASNARDDRNFSRSLFRPPPAEILCDMFSQVTAVPEPFDGMPVGTRAIQLWDNQVPSYVLRIFGRPTRSTACECERSAEPTLTGVLFTLNSEELTNKLRHEAGSVARWARTIPEDARLCEELTLTMYARFPTAKERATMTAHLARDPAHRREAIEDLVWAMMNTREFLHNH